MGDDESTAALVKRALDATTGSVEDLAEEVGVSAHAIWAWAKGRRSPKPENRRKLAEALEQRGRDLMTLAEDLSEDAL